MLDQIAEIFYSVPTQKFLSLFFVLATNMILIAGMVLAVTADNIKDTVKRSIYIHTCYFLDRTVSISGLVGIAFFSISSYILSRSLERAEFLMIFSNTFIFVSLSILDYIIFEELFSLALDNYKNTETPFITEKVQKWKSGVSLIVFVILFMTVTSNAVTLNVTIDALRLKTPFLDKQDVSNLTFRFVEVLFCLVMSWIILKTYLDKRNMLKNFEDEKIFWICSIIYGLMVIIYIILTGYKLFI